MGMCTSVDLVAFATTVTSGSLGNISCAFVLTMHCFVVASATLARISGASESSLRCNIVMGRFSIWLKTLSTTFSS